MTIQFTANVCIECHQGQVVDLAPEMAATLVELGYAQPHEQNETPERVERLELRGERRERLWG